MWKSIGGIFLALCVCASSFAQCPGGSCPNSGPPSIIDIGNLPVAPSQAEQYGPVKQEGNLLSIVRIIGVEGPGSMVKGSGTYVNYEGVYCVVTASHVVRGTQKIYVVFRGNKDPKTVQAGILSNDPTNDVAVLGLYQHPTDGEDIATSVAYAADVANIKNEILRNYGYGGDDILCGGPGRIVGEMGPGDGLPNSWYEISSYARLGDSGGPVFLPSGKLAGVLWGRDDKSIAVVKTGYIHVQLRLAKAKVGVEATQLVQPRPIPRNARPLVPVFPIKPPVLPWRDKIENEIDGIKKAPKCNPAPPVVAPAPPSVNVDVNINKPATPPVIEDERYRVETQVAILVIVGVVLLCLVIGVAVQWKKTYSIQ